MYDWKVCNATYPREHHQNRDKKWRIKAGTFCDQRSTDNKNYKTRSTPIGIRFTKGQTRCFHSSSVACLSHAKLRFWAISELITPIPAWRTLRMQLPSSITFRPKKIPKPDGCWGVRAIRDLSQHTQKKLKNCKKKKILEICGYGKRSLLAPRSTIRWSSLIVSVRDVTTRIWLAVTSRES